MIQPGDLLLHYRLIELTLLILGDREKGLEWAGPRSPRSPAIP
jgi:hypothetical protein